MRLLSLSVFTVSVCLGATAQAQSMFGLQMNLMESSSVNLDLVSAAEDGYVVLYDYRLGDFGEELGRMQIHAGANPDVRLNLNSPVRGDVTAVIYAGEPTTPADGKAMLVIDVNDN